MCKVFERKIWHNIKIIITDFSKPIRLVRPPNKQNDGMWIDEDDDDVSCLVKGEEKFAPGVMLWGAMYSGGLIPKNGPVFSTDVLRKKCNEINEQKISVDNAIYADFITNDVRKILERELPNELDDYIWQDNCATTQRTKFVLEEISKIFPNRINTKRQAAKMADVWCVEKEWMRKTLNVLNY